MSKWHLFWRWAMSFIPILDVSTHIRYFMAHIVPPPLPHAPPPPPTHSLPHHPKMHTFFPYTRLIMVPLNSYAIKTNLPICCLRKTLF